MPKMLIFILTCFLSPLLFWKPNGLHVHQEYCQCHQRIANMYRIIYEYQLNYCLGNH